MDNEKISPTSSGGRWGILIMASLAGACSLVGLYYLARYLFHHPL